MSTSHWLKSVLAICLEDGQAAVTRAAQFPRSIPGHGACLLVISSALHWWVLTDISTSALHVDLSGAFGSLSVWMQFQVTKSRWAAHKHSLEEMSVCPERSRLMSGRAAGMTQAKQSSGPAVPAPVIRC